MCAMTKDERAIRELVATWMAASANGETDTVLSLMADDVVLMVPGREPFGKEEFAAASRGMTDLHIEGSCEIEEIEVMADRAYMRNRLTITITPKGGEAEAFGLYSVDPAQGERRALGSHARRQSARRP